MGVRELFRGNFLIFTIAKNTKFITKYAHVNLSLMMSPPVDPAVDKTRNTEHSGTSRNIPEHEKIKIIFMKKNIIK